MEFGIFQGFSSISLCADSCISFALNAATLPVSVSSDPNCSNQMPIRFLRGFLEEEEVSPSSCVQAPLPAPFFNQNVMTWCRGHKLNQVFGIKQVT